MIQKSSEIFQTPYHRRCSKYFEKGDTLDRQKLVLELLAYYQESKIKFFIV